MNKKSKNKPRSNLASNPKKDHNYNEHNVNKIKETLRIIIKKFDMNFFTKLLRQTSPSQKLRNLILIFLTLFHDELNNLIEESSPIPEYT